MIWAAMALCVPMASIVTRHPCRSKRCNNSGIAVMRIGFLIDGQLGQHHPILGSPSAHQRPRLLPVSSIMGASQRFSINGNDPGDLVRHPCYPGEETLLKLLGINALKNALQAVCTFFFHLSPSTSCSFGLYSITSPQNLDAIALQHKGIMGNTSWVREQPLSSSVVKRE